VPHILIDHPHSYREWNIVGQCDVPGFFYLESRFRLNPGEQPATYTAFELCLHECEFDLGLVNTLSAKADSFFGELS
jgi:hypothetical protein